MKRAYQKLRPKNQTKRTRRSKEKRKMNQKMSTAHGAPGGGTTREYGIRVNQRDLRSWTLPSELARSIVGTMWPMGPMWPVARVGPMGPIGPEEPVTPMGHGTRGARGAHVAHGAHRSHWTATGPLGAQ